MRDVLKSPRDDLIAGISHDLAQALVDVEPSSAGSHVGYSDSSIFERRAELGFAPPYCALRFEPRSYVVKIAHHSMLAIGHGHALDLPFVSLLDAEICALSGKGGRIILLAGLKRVPEDGGNPAAYFGSP